ncbi:MAG: hypothetical protein ACP5JY_02930, partial [Candidatus Nanoarchaeia archaeon]
LNRIKNESSLSEAKSLLTNLATYANRTFGLDITEIENQIKNATTLENITAIYQNITTGISAAFKDKAFQTTRDYLSNKTNGNVTGNTWDDLNRSFEKYLNRIKNESSLSEAKSLLTNLATYANNTFGLDITEIKEQIENATLENITAVYQNIAENISVALNNIKEQYIRDGEAAAWREFLRVKADDATNAGLNVTYAWLNRTFGNFDNKNVSEINNLSDAVVWYKSQNLSMWQSLWNDSANSNNFNYSLDKLQQYANKYSGVFPSVIAFNTSTPGVQDLLNVTNGSLYNFLLDVLNNGGTARVIKAVDGTFIDGGKYGYWLGERDVYNMIKQYVGEGG